MGKLFFENIAKSDSGIYIADLEKRDWKKELFSKLNPQFVRVNGEGLYGGQNSFENLLDLAKDALKARSAVLEPYISTDWNEEYASLYSRIFSEAPRLAQRIHFFGEVISYNSLFEMSEQQKYTYLGYTVVRPLHAFRVGDTLLASPCTVDEIGKNRVHCLEKFDVSLLGNQLEVVGMPFIQQETSVGVCADAVLWMLARYLNKKGETRRYRPAEIHSLATKTLTVGPAREGLLDVQMVDALRQMGLNPILLYPSSPEEAKEVIYSCIESELPVIAGIPGHVVVIIGHDYIEFGDNIGTMSDAVGSFIVHDDASGPYRKMKLGKITKDLEHGRKKQFLTLNNQEVESCIIPFPERVYMRREDVKIHTTDWLEKVNHHVARLFDIHPSYLWASKDIENLVIRAYLRLSRSFKCDILNRHSSVLRNERIIAKYKCMQMPKYIWVVELASRSDLKGNSMYERKIRGEIIFDSTGNRHVPEETLMAFHLNGIMFIPRRTGKPSELFTVNESPYSPLQRSIRQHQNRSG